MTKQQDPEKPSNKVITIVSILLIASIGVIVLVHLKAELDDQLNPGQYWRIDGTWENAPDGQYIMQAYLSNGTHVFSPVCEHSGSQLHGIWEIKPGLILEDGWYLVRLENNVIIDAKPLETLT